MASRLSPFCALSISNTQHLNLHWIECSFYLYHKILALARKSQTDFQIYSQFIWWLYLLEMGMRERRRKSYGWFDSRSVVYMPYEPRSSMSARSAIYSVVINSRSLVPHNPIF